MRKHNCFCFIRIVLTLWVTYNMVFQWSSILDKPRSAILGFGDSSNSNHDE